MDPAAGRSERQKRFLLHVVRDARAQFHGGGESEGSGCRGRHVGLQDRLQGVQDVVLADLVKRRVKSEQPDVQVHLLLWGR